MYLAEVTKLLLLSLLIKSSLQTTMKPIASSINPPAPYDTDGPIFCGGPPCSKLYDYITNEGLAFNADRFYEWNRFSLKFFFHKISSNYFFNRIDIYYYSYPSSGYGLPRIKMYIRYPRPFHGVHLTFINNYKVSQSDNDTIMLSMIVLNAKPYSTTEGISMLELHSFVTSSDLAVKFSISEVKCFIDTDPIPFSAVPIVFMSPNQTLQPDAIQPSLNLSCTVVNNGTFNWTWSGPGVSNAVIKVADTTRTSILMLSNISATDAGNYTCSASYLAMGESAWGVIDPNTNTNTISLTLFSSASATANTVTMEEGNDVTLSCIFTGYLPINYENTWMDSSGMKPSNGIIANGENTQFRSQRGSPSTSPAVQSNLTIASVKVADGGLYTCTMSGTGVRDTILLIVFRQVTQIELEY